jgi:non-specific protein-tyrosine kinase
VVEEALPGKPVRTSSTGIMILQGFFVGLMVGVGVVLLIEYVSDTVKTKEEIEHITNVPTLGTIGLIHPHNTYEEMLVAMHDPESANSEAYRLLGTNLEHVTTESSIRTLVVTSSTPMEGKTVTAANLALSLAQGGWQVILVDMDLRRPTLHKLFQQPNKNGVAATIQESNQNMLTYLVPVADKLHLMTSGHAPSDASAILRSPRIVELIEELKSHADIIIIDSPPIMAVADPILIARIADAILLVVKARATKLSVLRQTAEIIEKSGAKLLGTVLNQVRSSGDGSYYYYDYPYYKKNKD